MESKTRKRVPWKNRYAAEAEEILYAESKVQSLGRPLTRSQRVDLLFKEFMRVSDVFHKAVDNYYKIIATPIPLIAGIYGISGHAQVSHSWISAIVPFGCLTAVLMEMQVRTTIMCASRYMALMERRICLESGFRPLLYERNLTLGHHLYLNAGGLLMYRVIAWIVVGSALFGIGWAATFDFLKFLTDLQQEPGQSGSSILFGCTISTLEWLYPIVVCVLAIWVALSWCFSFHFAWRKYEGIIEAFMERHRIPLDEKLI